MMPERAGPLLSVVIPTRNRPFELQRCLRSLNDQALPRSRWEVIVVVDGEDEHSADTLRAWDERLPLRWLRQAHAGCGLARNTGAEQAKGRFLVFTDDDCLFPPDWLSLYAQHIELYPNCIVAGRSINFLAANPYSQATQDLMDYLLASLNSYPEEAVLAIGNNFGVPADRFRRLGGFGSRYFRAAAEDRDFCVRWRQSGERIVYAPDIVVQHAHALTFASYIRQHLHYGRGAWLFHTASSSWKTQASPGHLEFYLSMFRAHTGLRSLALLFTSQAAQTIGYVSGWLTSSANH